MANKTSSQQTTPPAHHKPSLSDFPDEILLEVIRNLPPVASVCLALTSHRFPTLILATRGKDRLNQIVPYNAVGMQDPAYASTSYRALMRFLVSWVPVGCYLCFESADKFINNTEWPANCLACARKKALK